MTRPLTPAELAQAMEAPVLLVTRYGENDRHRGVRKDLHYCPNTGEFTISASSGGDIIVQTHTDAIRHFNDIDLRKLK